MTTEKKKVPVQIFYYAKYDRILDELRHSYETNEVKGEALKIPYIVTCALALEGLLNDTLIEHAFRIWKDKYKSIAKSYISMTFRSKLDSVFSIITDNKFRINPDDQSYLLLSNLISTRNNLVHSKSFLQEIEISPKISEVTGKPQPDIESAEITDALMDMSFGVKNMHSPVEYHAAIWELQKALMDYSANKFKRYNMVIENENT